MPQRLDPKEARQGERGFPVLKVLVAALVLAMIAWAIASMFGESTEPEGRISDTMIEDDDAAGALGDTGAPTVEE